MAEESDWRRLAGRRFLALYFLVFGVLSIIILLQIWQLARDADEGTAMGDVTVDILWWDVNSSAATVVLFYVATLGLLGASIQGMRALGKWSRKHKDSPEAEPEDQWDSSYTLWYIFRPVIGAGLALVVYLALVGSTLGDRASSA